MTRRRFPTPALCLALLVLLSSILPLPAAGTLIRRAWQVDGVAREALVYLPAQARATAAPIVFAFHGHGGSMSNAARLFGFHTVWPEAIVVYPQGLNTPGRLTDLEGKRPGWQKEVGDQKDRDLKFVDAMLAGLRQDYRADARRVYATGHSNGAAFTYLLWEARGEQFAALAPSAGAARELMFLAASTNQPLAGVRKPRISVAKPLLHLAGENDPLVKFEWQRLTIDGACRLNQCGEGKPWKVDPRCTIYASKAGAPVVTYLHRRLHAFPPEAPNLIVAFFKTEGRGQ